MSLTKVSYSMIAGAPASVLDFGAVGNGIADDTAAIQAAINSVISTGGSVYFPTGKYKITQQINVRSIYPIHLVGDMGGQIYNSTAQSNLAGIIIGANISGSIIRYAAPSNVSRNEGGGGSVSGLSFYDATAAGGANPGIYTCTAALELTDFNLSKVKNCYFHWINGSAITGEFMVMTNITGNVIRYCGATNKPVVHLNNAVSGFTPQSVVVSNNKIEVCHGAPYIKMTGVQCTDIKISDNGFETAPDIANTNQIFVQTSGSRHAIVGNSFNRVNATQLLLESGDTNVSANTFAGGPYTSSAILINSGRVTIVGNSFVSTRKKYEVEFASASAYNVFSNNSMYFSGAVYVDSAYTTVANNVIVDAAVDSAEFLPGRKYIVQTNPASAPKGGVVISGNTLFKSASALGLSFGGILMTESAGLVSGNYLRGFIGADESGIGIRNETTDATIVGNVGADVSTLISTTGYSALVLSGNNQLPTFTNFPLINSVTYDPPSLNDGAGVTTTVAVTGATPGDFVDVSFSLDLQGITLTAYAFQNNNVAVRFQNESGGSVNLGSGTLKVVVRKR